MKRIHIRGLRVHLHNHRLSHKGGAIHHLKHHPHNIDKLKKELKHINIQSHHHKKSKKKISI